MNKIIYKFAYSIVGDQPIIKEFTDSASVVDYVYRHNIINNEAYRLHHLAVDIDSRSVFYHSLEGANDTTFDEVLLGSELRVEKELSEFEIIRDEA